MQDRAIVTIEH